MKKGAIYARISRFHQIILGTVYLLILGATIVLLSMLGSRIRTRALPSGSISLQIPYSKYLVGEPVTFTVKNNYNSAIYIANNCPAEPLAVYRFENQKWVRIHDNADIHECHTEDRQIRIPAGGSTSGSFAGWHNLLNTPGKYRVVVFVEFYNTLPYQDFEVIEKPKVPDIPAIIPKKTTVSSSSSPTTRSGQSASGASAPSSSSSTSSTTTDTAKQQTVSIAAGNIAVSYTSSTVTILSITPATGYTYEVGRMSGTSVQVTFKKSHTETQVTLSMRNGQLIQKVEQD